MKICGLCPPSSRPPRSVRVCSLLYSPVFFFPFKFVGIFPASGTGSDQLRGSADTEGEGQMQWCGFTRGKLLLSPVRAWPGNQSATRHKPTGNLASLPLLLTGEIGFNPNLPNKEWFSESKGHTPYLSDKESARIDDVQEVPESAIKRSLEEKNKQNVFSDKLPFICCAKNNLFPPHNSVEAEKQWQKSCLL